MQTFLSQNISDRNINFNNMRPKNAHSDLSNDNPRILTIIPYFDLIEDHLIEHIKKASYVVGCVAWLTNSSVIDALASIKGAKIIVNKEEYLSSKMSAGKRAYYNYMREKYSTINDLFKINCTCCCKKITECEKFKQTFGNIDIESCIKPMSTESRIVKGCTVLSSAIHACGIVNNFSKMHHKFLIFMDDDMIPTGVWTGSYNFSRTSKYSLENAIYFNDEACSREYIKEFISIYPYSECSDWRSGLLHANIKH